MLKKLLVPAAAILACVSCTVVSRYVRYGYADIYDYRIFPCTPINPGGEVFSFKQADRDALDKIRIRPSRWRAAGDSVSVPLDDFLKSTSTVSFLVIRNDSILFERYYKGFDRERISTFFSTSKSITSLLVGLAVDDGYIGSVDDPITLYLPELKGRAPQYERLTIKNLLNMRSGLKFTESYTNPFKGMARLYYGTNQMGQLKRMKFEHEPGAVFRYQSASTALLGMAVERATGRPLGKYLEESIWVPLGMENRATWSLDDRRHGYSKAYSSMNATAIDLAKIGRLYLNKGMYDGVRIIDPKWIEECTTPDINNGYQYQWYSKRVNMSPGNDGSIFYPDSLSAATNAARMASRFGHYRIWKDKNNGNRWRITSYVDFYTRGIMDQVMYVNPEKNIIVVRLGEKDDLDMDYASFIFELNKQL